MSALLPSVEMKSLAGLIIALLSLPKMVWSWGEKARLHAVLASRFKMLESDIEAQGEMNESQANAMFSKALAIECEEPAEYSALIRICQNEIANARGEAQYVFGISWFQKNFAQLFDFPSVGKIKN